MNAIAIIRALKNGPMILLILGFLLVTTSPVRAQTATSLPGGDTLAPTPQEVAKGRQNWGVDMGFGGGFVQGATSDNSINGNFDVFKTLSPNRSQVYLNGQFINNAVNSVNIVNQGSLTALYNNQLFLPDSFKFFVYDTEAYNNLLLLNYRTTNAVGACWDDMRLGASRQTLSLALSVEHEDFSTARNDTTVRAVFHDELNLPISKTAKIHADFFYMPSVAAINNYRLSGEISLETLIWAQYLGLKVAWNDEYDSYLRQYAPVSSLDYSVWTTALTYHFGK